MTALPIAFYLKELSGDASRRRNTGPPGAEEASDLEFQIKEAYARGIAEGRAAAEAERQAAESAQAAAVQQRMESERKAWADAESGRLAALIAQGFEDLERRVTGVVSDTLKPVLHEQVRQRAVDELARSLNGLLSKGEYSKIEISGPADLLEKMKTALAAAHAGLSFVETASVDVSVSADDTILATQIGAWAHAISEGNA